MSESEARTSDEDGNELYLDIDLSREMMDGLIGDLVEDTVKATRETLEKAGLSANDLERIVFVGGPTNYKPLRDRVCEELALPADIDVNPMTAVAEGASIFAESIDWSTANHSRKAANAVARTNVDIAFKYTARVSGDSARVMCMTEHQYDGYTLIITSRDSGWSSGSIPLRNQAQTTLPLIKNGENTFDVKVLDNYGREVPIGVQRIVITKTLATIGAIPASHSIGVEMLDRLGGIPVYTILIHEGDSLPKRDTVTFRAGQTLKAGSNSTINIKLWEGNIESPITITLAKGKTHKLTASVIEIPEGITASKISWKSGDKGVATFSSGTVTAVAAGTTEIVCESTLSDGTVLTNSCTVTVVVPVSSITSEKTSYTLYEDEQIKPSITVKPSAATNSTVTYDSSDTNVVIIDEDGNFIAMNPGKATVTVSALDGSGKTLTINVTVKEREPVQAAVQVDQTTYIGNKNTKVFHYPGCSSVSRMKESNMVEITGRDQAIKKGYKPCGRCTP